MIQERPAGSTRRSQPPGGRPAVDAAAGTGRFRPGMIGDSRVMGRAGVSRRYSRASLETAAKRSVWPPNAFRPAQEEVAAGVQGEVEQGISLACVVWRPGRSGDCGS